LGGNNSKNVLFEFGRIVEERQAPSINTETISETLIQNLWDKIYMLCILIIENKKKHKTILNYRASALFGKYLKQINQVGNLLYILGGRNEVIVVTRYELDSSGLNPGVSKRFSIVHTLPHQLRSLISLLYNWQKCSFPGVKLQTCGVYHPLSIITKSR